MSKREPALVTHETENGDTVKYKIECFGFRKANKLLLKYLPVVKQVMEGGKSLTIEGDDDDDESIGIDIKSVIGALSEIPEDTMDELMDKIMEVTFIKDNPDVDDWRSMKEDDFDYDIFAIILTEICKLNYSGFLRIGSGIITSSLTKEKSPIKED